MKFKTEAARTAVAIRQDLKQHFPTTKFKVISDNYAGGNAVRIDYENSVPSKEVQKIVDKYQYGHFDGMTDYYDASNIREDIPQVKYVQVQRKISAEIRAAIKEEIATSYGIKDKLNEQEWYDKFSMWSDQMVWKETQERTF